MSPSAPSVHILIFLLFLYYAIASLAGFYPFKSPLFKADWLPSEPAQKRWTGISVCILYLAVLSLLAYNIKLSSSVSKNVTVYLT